jgi:hypothetical protein
MHNWYEGVLQHHFRYRWNINGSKKAEDTSDDNSQSDGGSVEEDNTITATSLSNPEKEELIRAIHEVIVPTGITPMPKGLGESKNGKLKAAEWHSLFAFHLPLAVLDVFVNFDDIDGSLLAQENTLKNICSLIECTHLVSSREITDRCSKKFAENYQIYMDTSRLVFPKSRILPNHHYALHIPAQL